MKIPLFLIINTVLYYIGFAQIPSLEWVKTIGGTSSERAESIITDNVGNIYLTGFFADTVDFNPDAGVYNLVASEFGTDAFVQKLDNNGNLLWAKSYGGPNYNQSGSSICIDNNGDIIIIGRFEGSPDLDPGVGIQNFTSNGSNDFFIQKIDSNGNLIWVKTIGGNQNDEAFGVETDQYGNIYITGYFSETVDFDPDSGTNNITSFGQTDAFILKLNSSGALVWVKSIQGSDWVMGYDLKVDEAGNSYIVGRLDGTADFDPNTGTYSLTSNAYSDIFIMKLDNIGTFQWAGSFGGNWGDESKSISLDNNNLYITGKFVEQVDFNPGIGVFNLGMVGIQNAFVSKFDIDGNFIWAKEIGGNGYDSGNSVCNDGLGNIYLTGQFYDTVDFDLGTGTANHTSSGGGDIFALKLNSNGDFVWAESIGSSETFPDWGVEIYCDNSGNPYLIGHYSGLTDFDPGTNILEIDINGGTGDFFIQKLGDMVGIHEDKIDFNIVVYPNPANESFVISQAVSQEYRVELYDYKGVLILEKNAVGKNTLIETGNLPGGQYVLIIDHPTGFVSRKKLVIR